MADLHRYDILDTAPEKEFDDLVLLASRICPAPVSLITLLDTERQWFKTGADIGRTETHYFHHSP